MPRPPRTAYWREWSRKRREDPTYREKQRNWYKQWYEAHKADPSYKAKAAARMRKYTRDPELRERHMARWILNRRIASGQVIPQPCERCGNQKTQGHHADYGEPLAVRWLCGNCHRQEHTKATSPQAQ